MESLQRSFKSYGSHKYSSSCSPSLDLQEELPILVDLDEGERREVVVKIDGNSHFLPSDSAPISSSSPSSPVPAAGNPWREGSYDLLKVEGALGSPGTSDSGGSLRFSFKNHPRPPDHGPNMMAAISEDPPWRITSSFFHSQRTSGTEVSPNKDLEMEDLRRPSASKELHVSFQDPSVHSRKRSSDSDSDADDSAELRRGRKEGVPAEVLRCTSNSSVNRATTLLRAKTRSRLMDPPHAGGAVASNDDEKKSRWLPNKSGQLRSGMIGKSGPFDEDDEDPFVDEDIPDDFKRAKFDFLTILQWVGLVLNVAALVCSLAIPRLQRQTVWELHLWKWELLVFVLICGRLVSGWLIRILVFFVERNFLLRKRVLYFVYGVRKAVQNSLWLGLVLLSWLLLFDKKVARETHTRVLPYVTKVLLCLLVATLVRLVKTLLLKVLASSFHVSTYFDRIQEALFNQYVIETLSGPPMIEIQQHEHEHNQMIAEVQKFQRAGATIPSDVLRAVTVPTKAGQVAGGSSRRAMRKSGQIGKSIKLSGAVSRKDFSQLQQPHKELREEVITIDQLHKLDQKNISAWNMKRLMRIVRYGTLTTLDEQIPQATMEDDSTTQIRSECEAKFAARRIFTNVAKPGAKYIYLMDLLHFMRKEESVKTMSLFEGAQDNNRVSRRSLKNWVVNAFRDRKALALTLNDTKTAVNTLHQMANIVVALIVLALWLLILGIATTHFFVFLSSQLLVAVFIFGNTLKTIFEAIVFLFVMHPFDVGDRCEVEDVQMIVEEMNIMTTIFLRYDNLKIYYPNSVLATKPICNFYRSPDMGDSIDFCVHVATPAEKLAIMKERIVQYMESKREHWYPGSAVVLRDVEDMNRLKVSIWMRQRMNFQDMGTRHNRRELVVQEMIKVLKELDIEYRMLPLDINVRDLPPIASTRMPSTWVMF